MFTDRTSRRETAARVRARFERHVAARRLLDPARPVFVALSGGLDSMCLLHLLRFGSTGYDLTAAHFDHALRARSGADALWVRGVCRAWHLPLVSARAEDPPHSENAARELRYAFLAAAAAGRDATIVTAHHADDQAETVLFRLVRGTGPAGMTGIPERRGPFVRPLLRCTRAELRAYAAAVGLQWREDETNEALRFARNRIRHVVLPALERVHPGAAAHIAHFAERAAESERGWRAVVRAALHDVVTGHGVEGFTLARERLLAYHPHIRARVIRHLLQRLGTRLDRRGTRSVMEFINSGASGSGLELAGGVRVEREFKHLLLRAAQPAPEDRDVPLVIAAPRAGTGSFVAGGQRYQARWGPPRTSAAAGPSARFDPSSLRFPLELRAWRAGDRIRLGYGSKKLKKLFQERRLGRRRRARVPVVVDAAGEVLWVPDVVRSVAAGATEQDAAFEITVTDGTTD